MTYIDELTAAMDWLAAKPETLFIGQSVAEEGTAQRKTLKNVAADRLLEFPVAENLQCGVSLGLSLEGYTPVSCFPRYNFLILALDQMVNHLDKLPLYSAYKPRVLIRTAIGRHQPLDPGPQHKDNFSPAMKTMLKTVQIYGLPVASHVVPAYQKAYTEGTSALLIEEGNQC